MKPNANLRPDDDSVERGAKAEDAFVISCWKKGYQAYKSSKKDDIYNHIDYWVKNKAGDLKGFDVKARKRTSRNSNRYSDDWIWIEFKNVIGKDGWIKGKADFIAFEFENNFLIVKREELRELCKKLIKDTKTRVTRAKDAKYLLYTRHGRKDLVTQIKLSDIKNNLKTWDWCK